MPNPDDNPELYDHILLGGVQSPGIVTLSGHDRDQKWDVADPQGQTGASSKYGGEKIAGFTATFYLCKDLYLGVDDFADWESFQHLIESTFRGSKPVALEVYHPDLALNRINKVCGAKVGGLVQDNKGGATVAVNFIEYRPPKKKTVKSASPGNATHKIGKSDNSSATDPNAAAKAELAKLVAEVAAP